MDHCETSGKRSPEATAIADRTGCPICGAAITRTQYVVARRMATVKCSQCATVLRYSLPSSLKWVMGVLGYVLALMPVPFLAVGTMSHFVLIYLAYAVPMLIGLAYAEAVYVQAKFAPAPQING